MTEHSPATDAMARWVGFVGIWETEGEIEGGSGSTTATFRASDVYEWLPGGHFLLHRFDADMPGGRTQGIEVIGHDGELDAYPMHSFDNAGNASVMHARLEGDTWTFLGKAIRFIGGFRDAGAVFAGTWQTRSSDDSAWTTWMTVTLRKCSA
jgi:hypothetical protein